MIDNFTQTTPKHNSSVNNITANTAANKLEELSNQNNQVSAGGIELAPIKLREIGNNIDSSSKENVDNQRDSNNSNNNKSNTTTSNATSSTTATALGAITHNSADTTSKQPQQQQQQRRDSILGDVSAVSKPQNPKVVTLKPVLQPIHDDEDDDVDSDATVTPDSDEISPKSDIEDFNRTLAAAKLSFQRSLENSVTSWEKSKKKKDKDQKEQQQNNNTNNNNSKTKVTPLSSPTSIRPTSSQAFTEALTTGTTREVGEHIPEAEESKKDKPSPFVTPRSPRTPKRVLFSPDQDLATLSPSKKAQQNFNASIGDNNNNNNACNSVHDSNGKDNSNTGDKSLGIIDSSMETSTMATAPYAPLNSSLLPLNTISIAVPIPIIIPLIQPPDDVPDQHQQQAPIVENEKAVQTDFPTHMENVDPSAPSTTETATDAVAGTTETGAAATQLDQQQQQKMQPGPPADPEGPMKQHEEQHQQVYEQLKSGSKSPSNFKKHEKLDLDMLHGSTFASNINTSFDLSEFLGVFVRLLFFPFFYSYITTSVLNTKIYMLGSAIYFLWVMATASYFLYELSASQALATTTTTTTTGATGPFTIPVAGLISRTEVLAPIVMFLVICLVYSRIYSAQQTNSDDSDDEGDSIGEPPADDDDEQMTNLLRGTKIKVKQFDRKKGREVKMILTLEQVARKILDRETQNRDSHKYYVVAILGAAVHCLIPSIWRLVEHRHDLHSMGLLAILNLWFGGRFWHQWFITSVCAALNFILYSLCLLALSFAELAYNRRLACAQYVIALTSPNRAKSLGLPWFRLRTVANIKSWLTIRAFILHGGPRFTVDIIVSQCFVSVIILSCLVYYQVVILQELSDFALEVYCDCFLVSLFFLRFLTASNALEKKNRSTSALLIEQFNLHLLMDQYPEEREELHLVHDVIKLAVRLIKTKDASKSQKMFGFSVSPLVKNVLRLVVLGAISAALSKVLGFNVHLRKLTIS